MHKAKRRVVITERLLRSPGVLNDTDSWLTVTSPAGRRHQRLGKQLEA
jgi:hypothetical protein